jgi:hypothetical protein
LVVSEDRLKRFAGKRSLFFYIFFIGALAAITSALLLGGLSPRRAAIAYLLSCFFAVAGATIILNRNLKDRRAVEVMPGNIVDAPDREDIRRKIRQYTIMVVVLPLILLYGLYESRGGPLLPRLTGAVVNILFTVAFIVGLRAQRGKLKK